MTDDRRPDLAAVVPARLRRGVYAGYAAVSTVAGSVAAYYAATGVPQPQPLTGGLAVLAYLAVPVAGLAAVNTPRAPRARRPREEPR